MNDELIRLAEKIDRLARTARVQDLGLLLDSTESERIARVATVLDQLGPGVFLIGSGPYTQGVYSLMTDEVVLGRLATPLENSLDKPVDIFCHDIVSLVPREVSRYHAAITRSGEEPRTYFIRDLGSSCGTFVNGARLPNESSPDEQLPLQLADVISLGPSHVNTFVFFRS